MAAIFEVADEGLRPAGHAESLGEASAALPAGSYTTLRTYHGARVLRLEDHVRRLEQSLETLGHPGIHLERSRVQKALALALRATGYSESRVRVTAAPDRLFVSIEPFAPLAEALYRDGVACSVVTVRRSRPGAKDTRFIAEAARAQASLPAGIHEGLLADTDGALLEGLSSNFFALRGGTLQTEGPRALPGVTRSLVLELARARLPVDLTAVRVDQLAEVSECFLTSVSRGILPVVAIDGRAVGPGMPGALTRQLAMDLDTLAAREALPVDVR